jgi:hypothetical protein
MNTFAHGRSTAAMLALCLITGCVVVPYKPKAEVVESQEVALDPAAVMITLGPRSLVEEITEAIADEDKEIRIVPAQDFLNVAIPGEDATLQGLLSSGHAQRAREVTGADYLVLVGERKEYTTDEAGGMIPYLGFYGLFKEKDHTTLLSTIIDLAHARPLSDVSAHAQGTAAGAGAFYGLFIVPMTGSSARDGMVRGVVASLRRAAGPGSLAIAVAAGERPWSPEDEASPDEPGANPAIDELIRSMDTAPGDPGAPEAGPDAAPPADPPPPAADPPDASRDPA